MIRLETTIVKIELLLYAVMLLFLGTSIIVSPILSISIIKSLSFMGFIYMVFRTYQKGDFKENILLQFIESIVIVNILFYFIPYGYYKNGLFMGIFKHSQVIGLYLVPF